jgi:bacterioferritin-associated ferredoxin
MSRCECAGFSFAEIARCLREDGASWDELRARTGCGETCTACLPYLQLYLDATRG